MANKNVRNYIQTTNRTMNAFTKGRSRSNTKHKDQTLDPSDLVAIRLRKSAEQIMNIV